MHLPRRIAPAVAAALSAAVLASCSSASGGAGNNLPTTQTTHAGRVQVAAAESLWGNVAEQVGGDHVDVTSIISDPNQDPHEYESTVGDASTLSRAKLVIVNGAGYDPFMNRLLGVDKKPAGDVITVSKVVGASNGANPHLWYRTAYALQAAQAIEAALIRKQPAHRADFAAGLGRFTAGMQKVRSVIAAIRARHAGAPVGYTEPVPGYLVTDAGLSLGTPESFSLALENGTDPSPGDNAHFEQAVTGHRIKTLLLNTQVTDPETDRLQKLARNAHVPVVDVTETLPRGENFQTWQAAQASALLAALGG
ncbi:metal ABC transporter solute-binding protein, Zn/Mn family [uncultured Jatrophihabitans sp.]|uniref:metal ABC transporter solute-binding protein, Zn/Mn family n=1 Tax=uncultured Jatrophihabitans sp. TaxID=1610747 RepID=UPI0035CA31B8